MCRQFDSTGSTTVPDREVLPTNVQPYHYELTLEPNFEKFTFKGTVEILYVKSSRVKQFH
jgi:aminopeptidase 2